MGSQQRTKNEQTKRKTKRKNNSVQNEGSHRTMMKGEKIARAWFEPNLAT